MQRIMTFIFFAFIILLSGFKHGDKEILNKTISKLNSLERIEYDVTIQSHDNIRENSDTEPATCYFDFTSNDNIIGAKSHFLSNYGEEVFDGETFFISRDYTTEIVYTNAPSKRQVWNSILMQNSLYALRKLLPEIINDPSISITLPKDTIIHNQEFYKFTIKFEDKIIDIGAIVVEQKGTTIDQILIINKENFLPYSYATIYPQNRGYRLATFKNLNINASKPDSIWTYERFPKEFTRLTFKESLKLHQESKSLFRKGKKVPSWTLPMIDGDPINLSSQQGNLVLLEFWYPYCKGCIIAVPEINEIQDIYINKGLKVYGIEYFNSEYEKISQHIKKYNIDYPTLYEGKKVAKEFGVRGAPTFFLIDKNGRFIYSSVGLNRKELIKAINKNL